MSQPDLGGPPPVDDSMGDDEELYNPITYEAPIGDGDAWMAWDPTPRDDGTQDDGAQDDGRWPDESWPPRRQARSRRPQWIAASVAVAAIAAAGISFALAGGSSPASGSGSASGAGAGGRAARPSPSVTFPPGMAPPITPAAARAVMSRYTTANNAANARMDPLLLGGYETGGSRLLDASVYATRRADGLKPYPAFAPAETRFFIPAQPVAAWPHWFAVQVANRALGGGHEGLGTEYLLFTQSGPGAAWKDAAEPYLLRGASAPRVALEGGPGTGGTGGTAGTGGYATAVAFTAPGLAVSPSRLAQATADSLDGHGPVAGLPALADAAAVSWWRARLPKGTTITDHHTQTGYGIRGVRTADGGALLLFTDAAVVTFTAPRGATFRLSVPGAYDGRQPLSWAGLRFLDQLAVYDPPGGGRPRVVADYSGVQGRLSAG